MSWNARRWDLKDRGFGGHFMHNRPGLVTPYLSDEWMDRVQHVVRVSVREGLHAYLYDEDKWPSGYAGGAVPKAGVQYRNTMLQLRSVRPSESHIDVLAVFDGEGDGLQRVEQDAPGDVKYVCQFTEPLGNPWFNDTAYVDLMNPEAVQKFFDVTLEPYAELVGEHFGGTIPGVFTDEPSYIFWHGIPGQHPTVPWTRRMPEEYRKRWGEEILDDVMSLFEETGDWRKVRYQFWRTATELFIEAFSEPYGKWCDDHELKLTGHYMQEDTLHGQVQWIGAAMPHYEYMGWPGMDHLDRNIDNVMTAKQVSSVCHQLGKRRALSELYGCSGQHFSFKERKWIADWHMIHGINLMTPHLTLYTMRGARKRDYPPNIGYQQPWWCFNNIIADYKARTCYALTRGRRVTSVLVVHPHRERVGDLCAPTTVAGARRRSATGSTR